MVSSSVQWSVKSSLLWSRLAGAELHVLLQSCCTGAVAGGVGVAIECSGGIHVLAVLLPLLTLTTSGCLWHSSLQVLSKQALWRASPASIRWGLHAANIIGACGKEWDSPMYWVEGGKTIYLLDKHGHFRVLTVRAFVSAACSWPIWDGAWSSWWHPHGAACFLNHWWVWRSLLYQTLMLREKYLP